MNQNRSFLYFILNKPEVSGEKKINLFDKVVEYPQRPEWKFYLDRALLALASLFTVSGIIFFFAYNWSGLHKFAKLGTVSGLILLVGVFTIFADKEKLGFK